MMTLNEEERAHLREAIVLADDWPEPAKGTLISVINFTLKAIPETPTPTAPTRTRLPDERESITKKFTIPKPPHANACPKCRHAWEEAANLKVYTTVGLYPDSIYPDRRPGEIFITADRAGTTARGVLRQFGMAVSIGLQYGIPLRAFAEKMKGTRFGAGGLTADSEFRVVSSILDGVGRWFLVRFCGDPVEVRGVSL
jgi:hypothetical protein